MKGSLFLSQHTGANSKLQSQYVTGLLADRKQQTTLVHVQLLQTNQSECFRKM